MSGRTARRLAVPLGWLVRGYRVAISPLLGSVCRYTPSCSEYALVALETHGAFRGTWLALRRISRCHPWGGAGHDPVPAAGGGRSPREDRACGNRNENGRG